MAKTEQINSEQLNANFRPGSHVRHRSRPLGRISHTDDVGSQSPEQCTHEHTGVPSYCQTTSKARLKLKRCLTGRHRLEEQYEGVRGIAKSGQEEESRAYVSDFP
jgi:hypothetical protein